MFCRFCGAGIDDDSVFCPECGKRLKAPDKGADPQRAEIESVGSKQPPKADNVKSSVNVPYYICIGAYLLFVISCFLPTVSVKVLGYELANITVFGTGVNNALDIMSMPGYQAVGGLSMLGMLFAGILILRRNHFTHVLAGVISIFFIGYFTYVAVSISQQYLFSLGFGGILMIISGITLIVSCFAYKKDDN